MAQAQPQQRQNRGFTADEVKTFVMFIHNGDLPMLKLELQGNPALVDAKNAEGYPMLHVAIEWTQEEVLDLLLQRGANPKAVDDYGRTAESFATQLNFTSYAEKIRAKRVEIERQEKSDKMKRDYDAAVQRFTTGAKRPSEQMRATFRPKKRVL